MNNTTHDPHTLAGGTRALENATPTYLTQLDVGLLVERMTTDRLFHYTLLSVPCAFPIP